MLPMGPAFILVADLVDDAVVAIIRRREQKRHARVILAEHVDPLIVPSVLLIAEVRTSDFECETRGIAPMATVEGMDLSREFRFLLHELFPVPIPVDASDEEGEGGEGERDSYENLHGIAPCFG